MRPSYAPLRHLLLALFLAAGLSFAADNAAVDLKTEPATPQVDTPAEASAATTPFTPAPTPVVTGRSAEGLRLKAGQAIVLGLVEGITEFLPISSTGHLIIANEMLGLEDDTPLVDAKGQALWFKKPSDKHPEGERLTVKLAADTYTVIIQVGAIAAVLLLYRKSILAILKGLTGKDPEGLTLLRNLVLATIPVVVIGLIATKINLEDKLFSVQAVIVAQISGAVLMIFAERWRKQRSTLRSSQKDATDLAPVEATSIGFMQCLALWPGTSRSMVTIVGGYFTGLRPDKAAEFSFLVGLPVLGGAALLKGLKSGAAMIQVFGWDSVLLGIIVAAISAAVAVKFLVSFLSKHGLFAFAIYRFILAAALGAYFFL
jgi:undecaprenyl-diphosphatase